MKSIKHCSGKLKKELLKGGWLQHTNGGRWWKRWRGERVTLRTAAIREGLLGDEYRR